MVQRLDKKKKYYNLRPEQGLPKCFFDNSYLPRCPTDNAAELSNRDTPYQNRDASKRLFNTAATSKEVILRNRIPRTGSSSTEPLQLPDVQSNTIAGESHGCLQLQPPYRGLLLIIHRVDASAVSTDHRSTIKSSLSCGASETLADHTEST